MKKHVSMRSGSHLKKKISQSVYIVKRAHGGGDKVGILSQVKWLRIDDG